MEERETTTVWRVEPSPQIVQIVDPEFLHHSGQPFRTVLAAGDQRVNIAFVGNRLAGIGFDNLHQQRIETTVFDKFTGWNQQSFVKNI